MFINVDAVHDSPALPEQVDVVVIGGGIVGTTAAYELARQGVSVALLEKGLIGAEQSSRNWGWVRQQNRDMFELPLAMYSLDRWEAFSQEISRDVGFRRNGIVYTTDSQATLAKWGGLGATGPGARFYQPYVEWRRSPQARPGTTSTCIGGVWSPSDAQAEPSMACSAIATGAREHGAYLHQNCAVRGLDLHDGRVSGVWTEHGLIKASTVICAGGAWSSRFCRRHGVELPSANIMGTALQTTAAPEVTPGCLITPRVALRRRLDGSYTLALPGLGRVEISPKGFVMRANSTPPTAAN
ncbi:hypothetical protein HORIV_64000 [Vreelandella olivaria]|uniref:FAD dependent oxidoreductase domain-containing protein n=1 Tax=Vreelandella olivaria TaxID=390919 RepID=A0ABM7GTI4_9GAMM|nr:hypothetical protein HORIV_64000 [Halomonas olivaria]